MTDIFGGEGEPIMGSPIVPLEVEDRLVGVPAEILEQLQQYEWRWEDATDQAVRSDGHSTYYLYNELARYNPTDMESIPLLHRQAIRYAFGHLSAYRGLYDLVSKQRAIAYNHGIFEYPPAYTWLTAALGIAMKEYYAWLDRDTHYQYEEDPEKLIPGWMSKVPKGNLQYVRLGLWMDEELSGNWMPSTHHSTGLAPEPMRRKVGTVVRRFWKGNAIGVLDEAKPDEDPLAEFVAELEEKGRSVDKLVSHLLLIVGSYPIR